MNKTSLFTIILLILCLNIFGQHVGMTFKVAESQGIDINKLDSIYMSAVNVADISNLIGEHIATDRQQLKLHTDEWKVKLHTTKR